MGAQRARPALTLDAGALIAVERRDRKMLVLLEELARSHGKVVIPSGALAQAWRDGQRQTRLARLVRAKETVIDSFDGMLAQAAGALLGSTGTSDVVDAHVALCAHRTGGKVVTSDSGDIGFLDPSLEVISI